MITHWKKNPINELVDLRDRLSSRKQRNKSNVSLFKIFGKKWEGDREGRGKKAAVETITTKLTQDYLLRAPEHLF